MSDAVASSQARVKLDLFLLSVLSLFVELLAIRWLCSDIRAFAVFRTFPLVTCFIGLGVGLARKDDKLYSAVPVSLAALMLLLRLAEWLGPCTWTFPSNSVYQHPDPTMVPTVFTTTLI